MTKKNQKPITLDPKAEDIVQGLRLVSVGKSKTEISYNAIIKILVDEALQARGLL